MDTEKKKSPRKGSVIAATYGDVIIIQGATDGHMRLRISETRTSQNRYPKTAEVGLTGEQWQAIVAEARKLL